MQQDQFDMRQLQAHVDHRRSRDQDSHDSFQLRGLFFVTFELSMLLQVWWCYVRLCDDDEDDDGDDG